MKQVQRERQVAIERRLISHLDEPLDGAEVAGYTIVEDLIQPGHPGPVVLTDLELLGLIEQAPDRGRLSKVESHLGCREEASGSERAVLSQIRRAFLGYKCDRCPAPILCPSRSRL